MRVSFTYDREKDIWCLLNKGKSSSNSQQPTKVYEQLVTSKGTNPSDEEVFAFIEKYLRDNNIDIQAFIAKYQADWDAVADEYQTRAESIFDVVLKADVKAYITVNNRCPYSIENNYFFASMPSFSVRKTAMHELWHFYTWYGLGADQEQILGRERYNNLKEALTVLLNVECKDLMPEGVYDGGYPQHKDLREKILEFWAKERDIRKLWNYLNAFPDPPSFH